jgi:hypothetical protein
MTVLQKVFAHSTRFPTILSGNNSIDLLEDDEFFFLLYFVSILCLLLCVVLANVRLAIVLRMPIVTTTTIALAIRASIASVNTSSRRLAIVATTATFVALATNGTTCWRVVFRIRRRLTSCFIVVTKADDVWDARSARTIRSAFDRRRSVAAAAVSRGCAARFRAARRPISAVAAANASRAISANASTTTRANSAPPIPGS